MIDKKKSKYQGIFGDTQLDQPIMPSPIETMQQPNNSATQVVDMQRIEVVHMADDTKPTSQRRTGKRNNPDYFQSTAYIPTSLKYDVDDKLLKLKREQPGMDFSELIEALLKKWVNGEIEV